MKKRILIAVLVAVVVLSVGAMLWQKDGGADTVRITVEGAVVYEGDLYADNLPQTIDLHGKNGIESAVTIEHGRVHVDHANCPDQICVQQGWISDGTLPIVCLPGEIIIEVVGGEPNGLDTATG